MRLPRNIVLGLILLITINPILCSASEAANVPDEIYTEVAKNYEHIFIGTVINKTIESDRTFYIFNITEYLKHPLNTTMITATVYSGSEVVSPAGSYYVGEDYLVFFDELDMDNNIVGIKYSVKFVGSLSDSEIQSIREAVDISDVAIPAVKVTDINGSLAPDEASSLLAEPELIGGYQTILAIAIGAILLIVLILYKVIIK
jgi:hypothetical protein